MDSDILAWSCRVSSISESATMTRHKESDVFLMKRLFYVGNVLLLLSIAILSLAARLCQVDL